MGLLLSHVYGLRVIPQLAAIRDNPRRHADVTFLIPNRYSTVGDHVSMWTPRSR